MTESDGPVYGLVGALWALPRRLAARAVEASGGRLQRGTTRQTTHVVLGRTLLARGRDDAVETIVDTERQGGRTLLSERAFLARIGRTHTPGPCRDLSARALAMQSGLRERDLGLLSLFDVFEQPSEPFAFRDLILARKYAGLIASGASWGAIVRSVHRATPEVSLTALSLQLGHRQAIYARDGDRLRELDGQLLLALPGTDDDADEIFATAEALEAVGDYAEASRQYGRCLGLDPSDAIAAFNRANCLRASGNDADAEGEYARALRHDPAFIEAWFNLACLARNRQRDAAARHHLDRAIALDPDYADALFNLAVLEFDTGNLVAAKRHWERYLTLDSRTEWAQSALNGLRYIALRSRSRSAS